MTQPQSTSGARGRPASGARIVAFHAHPDDEVLFTGGVLAKAAREGHRVVVVVATAGERGLAADRGDLAGRRRDEMQAAADILGVHDVQWLGYGDSGFREPEEPPPGSFCAADPDEAAFRVAEILRAERADVLTVYDARGGYGHRDHRRVHEVGLAAAALAGTPTVLAATVDRRAITRGVRILNRIGIKPGGTVADDFADAFTPTSDITHEVDVTAFVRVKQAALRAHASQAGGGPDVRTARLLGALPTIVAKRVLGREWFVELGGIRPPNGPCGDIVRSVRSGTFG